MAKTPWKKFLFLSFFLDLQIGSPLTIDKTMHILAASFFVLTV